MLNKGSRVILSIGGNIGDTEAVFKSVVKYLQDNMIVDVKAVSPVYRSQSLLQDDQTDYLNIAVMGTTHMDPLALLNSLQDIETFFGRTPNGRWEERVIDIDIIDFGGRVRSGPRLTLPHPQMQNRSFVLLPMLDIVGDYVHPETGETVRQMYDALEYNFNITRVE